MLCMAITLWLSDFDFQCLLWWPCFPSWFLPFSSTWSEARLDLQSISLQPQFLLRLLTQGQILRCMAMPSTLVGLWGLASAWRVLADGKASFLWGAQRPDVPHSALQWISGWTGSVQSRFATSTGCTVFRTPAPPPSFGEKSVCMGVL